MQTLLASSSVAEAQYRALQVVSEGDCTLEGEKVGVRGGVALLAASF
jgi:hypothetical protein